MTLTERAEIMMAAILGMAIACAAIPGLTTAGPTKEAAIGPPRVAPARQLLHFEPNRGQSDGRVKFLARGAGYGLFLTPGEVVLALSSRHSETRRSAVLRLTLPGSEPSTEVMGRDPLRGKVNYLKGGDPSGWRTDIPTYGTVAYRGIYPGVDLVFYGHQGRLEFDFVLAPRVDPDVIRLAVDGADSVTLDAGGHLVLRTSAGEVRLQKPRVYQEMEGERREVAGGFVLEGRQIAFRVGVYDSLRPLVIDPVLVYSTYLGGSQLDTGEAIAVDASGNAYITGFAGSSDFPTSGGLQSAPGAFVSKLNADGAMEYSTFLGGSGEDLGMGIAVDSNGNAYVTGRTGSPNFPTVNAAQPLIFGTGVLPSCSPRCPAFNAFVSKLNASGSALVYSTFLGGQDGLTQGAGVAVDAAGNAYVTGTGGTDLGATTHFRPSATGGGFVAKYSAAGALLYLSDFGLGDPSLGIAVDAAGSAYVVGQTAHTDFPVTTGAFQTTLRGDFDAFVAKLNAAGSALVYSTYLGGSGRDMGFAIAVDSAGQAYVTGDTSSVDFPTVNAVQPFNAGGTDVFVAKLNAAGSALVYSTFLGGADGDGIGGGNGGDSSGAIAVDSAGRASVTGSTKSQNFPLVDPFQNALANTDCGVSGLDCIDAFVATLDGSGSTLLYSSYFGGSRLDQGTGIAVDAAGDLYVAGLTWSADFPTAQPVQPDFAGIGDAFVLRLSGQSTGCSGLTIGPTSATPSITQSGQTETITTRVCSGSAQSNLIVNLEIYDSSDTKVGQRVFTGQTFAPHGLNSYTWPFTVPSAPGGIYTVKIGVFSNAWSILHAWDNRAATFTVGTTIECGGGFTTGPTSATPSPVAPGQTEGIQTHVCAGTATYNVVVDLEIYDSGNAQVAQRVFTDQNFGSGETKTYDWAHAVPVALPAGIYTVKIGVFSADWKTLYTWNNGAATFTVGGQAACSGGFTIGPTSATPSPVARGQVETIRTQVCSGSGASNVLVDLEIYDSGGTKIAQSVFGSQSFAPGEIKAYSLSYAVPASLSPGPYTVKIGIFSGNWSTLHSWNNGAAAFTVQ